MSMNILDIGCGSNPIEGATILIDMNNTDYLQKIFPDKKIIQQDLDKSQKIDLESYQFDIVHCSSLYEHLENACHQCLTNEVYRLLRYRGEYILKLPNGYFITHRIRYLIGWFGHDNAKVHHHHFHRQEIIGMLLRAGFSIRMKKNLLLLLPSLFMPTIKIIAVKIE